AERAQIAAEKAAARKDFPEAGPSAAAASGQAPEDDADDPRRVAVIAAAVHSVIGDRPHRVVSIRSTGPGWAQEGRRQIFSSHRVR
ncbi:MAG: OadG family protein, partial [Verrucomicrobiota bacterium]